MRHRKESRLSLRRNQPARCIDVPVNTRNEANKNETKGGRDRGPRRENLLSDHDHPLLPRLPGYPLVAGQYVCLVAEKKCQGE